VKRLNPQTGKFFKRGDLREDGFMFHHYRYDRPLKDEYLTESWYSPAAFSQQNVGMAKCRERNREKARSESYCTIKRKNSFGVACSLEFTNLN